MEMIKTTFSLNSPAYGNGEKIPLKYCNRGVPGGQNRSVPLEWSVMPVETKSIALTMIDRHPIASNWLHWLVINIPTYVRSIPEGASQSDGMPAGSMELNNTSRTRGYSGPQPPPGSGDHEYEIAVYALSVDGLILNGNSGLGQFERAIEGKVIAEAKLNGVFGR